MQFSHTASGANLNGLPSSYDGELLVNAFLALPQQLTVKAATAVTELHMAGRNLTAIPPNAFVSFPLLAALWLSDNKLRCLTNLRGCERLKILHAARNHVHSLSPAEGCELIDISHSLVELDLSGNPLTNLDALLDELSCLPFLKSLALTGCPAAGEADYRPRTLARLSSLTTLDYRTVTPIERMAADDQYGATANGAARTVNVRRVKLLALRTEREEHEAKLTLRSSSPRLFSSLSLTQRADGLLADDGHEAGRSGLGRCGLSPPPASTIFGKGWDVKTTTRIALEKEANEIRVQRATENRRAAEAQFQVTETAASPGAMWSMTIDHSSLNTVVGTGSGAATSPASVRPQFSAQDTMKSAKSRAETARGSPLPGSPIRVLSPRSYPVILRRSVGGGGGGGGGSGSGTSSSPSLSSPTTRFTAPPITTSALINISQEAGCEDLFTRRLREEMAARGVPHDLLKAGTVLRNTTTNGSDGTAALLAALAPAIPKLSGTAPLLPDFTATTTATAARQKADFIGGGRVGEGRGMMTSGSGGGGGGGVDAGAGATLLAASGLLRTFGGTLGGGGGGGGGGATLLSSKYSSLANTLITAGARIGAAATMSSSPLALEAAVMAKTGTRLSLRRRPAATMARFGLTPTGGVDTSRRDFVDTVLGRGASSSSAADALISDDGGPILPSLQPNGQLGAWDQFRLINIFKKADTDNSGELTIDEIRNCLASAAEFGFCVAADEATPPILGKTVEAISRAVTPVGGSASTAFLDTVSLRGKAPALGATRKVNALLERIFEAVDADKSGTISWREFSDALEGKKPQGTAPDTPALPHISFRPLSATECSARSQRHYRAASTALATLNAIVDAPLPALCTDPATPPAEAAVAKAAHDAWVREASAVAKDEAHSASIKGARLMAMAKALAGVYDPAEAPQLPPPPRHDFFPLRLLAPATAVADIRAARGERARLRAAAIPMPGDEIDEDERAVMRVLHPSALEIEEEEADEVAGGHLRSEREELSAALLRTLGNQKWQSLRFSTKASAPRALHVTTTFMKG